MATTRFEALSFQSPRKLTGGHTFQNIRVTHLDACDPLVQ